MVVFSDSIMFNFYCLLWNCYCFSLRILNFHSYERMASAGFFHVFRDFIRLMTILCYFWSFDISAPCRFIQSQIDHNPTTVCIWAYFLYIPLLLSAYLSFIYLSVYVSIVYLSNLSINRLSSTSYLSIYHLSVFFLSIIVSISSSLLYENHTILSSKFCHLTLQHTLRWM